MAAEEIVEEPAEDGLVIASRYELISQLGVGGMGIVWRARDRRLARAVAVKVLSKTSVGSDVARTRLIREARAAAALEHEGIIRVYDVGETDDGGAFLVMELIRGQSLRGVLERGTMKLGTRADVIVQAARALQFAHEAGIVHRDVKPDNIMIRDDGRVTVVDFGVAKPLSTELVVIAGTVAGTPPAATLTGPGQLVGTPAYLAPEQARGLDVSAATDQFALAITAFEALTGKRPWGGTCFSDVIASLLRDAPAPISSAAQVPAALDEVLGRALAKNPADRYADIGAFADALQDAASELEIDEVMPSRMSSRDRRIAAVSLRRPSVPPAVAVAAPAATERSPAVAANDADPITSTLVSSVDAAKDAVVAADAAALQAASAAPRAAARGSMRYVLFAVLAMAIIAGVVWSLRRAPQMPNAEVPVEVTPKAATPVVTTTSTTTSTTTTTEATQPSAASTAGGVATLSMSSTAAATAAASHGASTAKASTAEPPRASASVPGRQPVVGASPATSGINAPLSGGATSSAAPPATEITPAPKPTGRRVRTEL